MLYAEVNTKDLEKTFENLAKEFGSQSLVGPTARALEKTIKPLEREIRRRTPKRTGKLRKRIYSEVYHSRVTGGLIGAVGYKFVGKKDIPQAISMLILEHGSDTRNYPRKRMLEKTFNKNKKKIIKKFAKNFEKEWNKAYPRLNKTKKNKLK